MSEKYLKRLEKERKEERSEYIKQEVLKCASYSQTEEQKERCYEISLINKCMLLDTEPDENYDSKQLEKGINVEHEHTYSDIIAKIIAKHHLKENPKYYECLEKMEKECK